MNKESINHKIEITEFTIGAAKYFEEKKKDSFKKSLIEMLEIKKEYDEARNDFMIIFGNGYQFLNAFNAWSFFEKLTYHISTGIPIELSNQQRQLGMTGLNTSQNAFNFWLKSLD